MGTGGRGRRPARLLSESAGRIVSDAVDIKRRTTLCFINKVGRRARRRSHKATPPVGRLDERASTAARFGSAAGRGDHNPDRRRVVQAPKRGVDG